ncbi:hypothetical protein BDA96_09G119600 [Sorghum bicolor]|uniref:Uncharacterized protein n=2 Tax=Sorghum bicolor TaxID=4558 RepID=C5YWW1_SORBI|nr:uncharacterized protein LOC8062701 [Sorghum bicolor]XP_021302436.1 uncharacterized protein LOC8062701 [Sorghum bicolor]XP_021302437.1 uncharacterized protein LOC8062701 [Sorghum bicolor]XP_021302438.1 uncharacterized protein LOC8062701 [Sorghum bicolor]EES18090.2 hypothetical protein SORBI_3009G113900 [Sorghum bicolor]EES18093.1 hypothetical protein SORBI_3009G113900 [Sorghum bicolor]KAG0517790.1 hypothetical protein BDA96_09G119600 [Sorghum bicolor]|eukprot:XP_002439663.1 uncharacterized protein LOC8062701 [Sorghum bicolor]
MKSAPVFKMEEANGAVDLEVDIIGPGAAGSKVASVEDPDATECSSSFGDTLSGSEDDARPSEISDIEVDSPFCRYPPNGDAAALLDAAASDNLDRLLKKKKVTDHWRKYVSPLMWRCQWLELRMKDLQSQVSKYDKELAVLKHEKELQTKMIELDCSSSRSVPFSSLCCRKTMKRRRRKRNEDKIDTSSYISNHTVFSYFEKTEADGHSIEDNANLADDNTKGNNDADWLLGIEGGDTTVEQILLSIQAAQDRVFSLRSNLKQAMAKKNKGITLKIHTSVNGTQSSNCSPGKGKVAGLHERSPQDTSECDMDDSAMPDSAVSSYGEASNMDIFESTMSLLSEGPHRIGEFRESSEDVLIDNQAAEEGYQNFEVISHPSKRLRVSVKREAGAHSEDESVAPVIAVKKEETQEEATTSFSLHGAFLKPCFTGKRQERKPKKQMKRRRGGPSAAAALISWRSKRIRKKKQL